MRNNHNTKIAPYNKSKVIISSFIFDVLSLSDLSYAKKIEYNKGARCADVARHTREAREPRRLFIKCRVTQKEREDLHNLMSKTGHRSEADFIRDAVFRVKPIVIQTASPTDQEIWERMVTLVKEFNRIGTNYNQIAIKVNTASIPMAQALEASRRTFSELMETLKRASEEMRS